MAIADFVDLESSSAVPVDLSYQHLNVMGGLPDGLTMSDPICKSTPPLAGSTRPPSVKVGILRRTTAFSTQGNQLNNDNIYCSLSNEWLTAAVA